MVPSKKKKYGPPFDKDGRGFKLAAREKYFPFDEVEDDSLTLKFAPIKFYWSMKHNRRLNSLDRV